MEESSKNPSANAGKTHPLPPPSNYDSMLGKLVVEKGLASEREVHDCAALLDESAAGADPNQSSLGDLLVSNGIITARQLERIRPLLEDAKQTQQIPGYQILAKLGAGAMATVYKAKQVSLDRIVAVKVLPRKHTSNPEFVERFYAEGRAAAKLNHSNIVQAIDVGKAGEFHYFVMEYVEGRTVYDDVSSGKAFSEAEALRLGIQIGEALDHAHKAGFIHRDVKPKNIMITRDGQAKLADMGLARAVTDREAAEAESGKAYGTPYYISPEQIRGERDIDFRTDIYSFGATLYHMVTGRVPFDGPSPSAVMHKHLKAELEPPDRIKPQLSQGLCEIIEVCMAKDKTKRYTSTADLLHDLQAVASGGPPLQARKKFDVSSLAALTKEVGPADETRLQETAQDAATPLFMQPIFFLAVAGWLVAIVLLVVIATR